MPTFGENAGIENPPEPVALIEAMRSIGYTTPTAIADLVDNSVSAGATDIRVAIQPPRALEDKGFLTVEDNGRGMSPAELDGAMKWGGTGPNSVRSPNDLGRFGLGLKTASLALGSTLTVASRANAGAKLEVRCWDMDYVSINGWRMLDYAPVEARARLDSLAISQNDERIGTAVVVTNLDRLNARANTAQMTSRSATEVTSRVATHLGMVFHRFITRGVTIYVGPTAVRSWDPFEGAEMKASEKLGSDVSVKSFVLPHPTRQSEVTSRQFAGPNGWLKHQGFHVYRADRLIVPGGWLRLFPAEDPYRLARVMVDLPNSHDAVWHLNVMKSSLTPPPTYRADLERIGDAIRRQARSVFAMRGARQVTAEESEPDVHESFWLQRVETNSIRFTINRRHPLVQSLKHQTLDPSTAENYLLAFERLLPLDAILQDPMRSMNGAKWSASEEDIATLLRLAEQAITLLRKQGFDDARAKTIVMAAEPFLSHADQLTHALQADA